MGLSSSKSETTEKTDQQTSQTMMPITPPYLQEAAQGYVGRIGEFAAGDPTARVAPLTDLQKQAISSAGSLGAWQGDARNATQMAAAAGKAGAAKAGTTGAEAFDYVAPEEINTQQADSYSLLDNLDAYQNPFAEQVIERTMAGLDQDAGITRALLAAEGARNRALSGSRFGVREALTNAELSRLRGDTLANLRMQGFNTAARFAGEDADRRQQVGIFNAGQGNENNRFLAGLLAEQRRFGAEGRMDTSRFNAGESNTAARLNAELKERANQRKIDAARAQGDISTAAAAAARADAMTQAEIGQMEREYEAALLNADLAQLQAEGALLQMTPYDILVGRQVDGTLTGTTNSVTEQSPSLISMGVGLGSLFL